MWATDTIHYKYRNRRWLLFQPIWRTQELYGNFKKRVRLAQEGIDSHTFVIEYFCDIKDLINIVLGN